MHSPKSLFGLILVVLAVTSTTTAVDPLYQTPGRVEQSNEVGPDPAQCQNSTLSVIGDGEILVSDCEAILNDLKAGDDCILSLSLWQNSTALVDHFWTYVTAGSCQFALKRVDGLNNVVYMSNVDFINLFNRSLALGNGSYVQTVEGTVPCISSTEASDPYAKIEWSLRQTGNVN